MTQLAAIINRLISDRDELTADISRRSGIDPAGLSRIRSGHQKTLTQKNLMALATAIGRDNRERAEIIAAHLRDQSCGYAPDLIQISIKGRAIKNREIDPDIEYLQQHLDDPAVRKLIRAAINLHRGNHSGNSEKVLRLFEKKR